MLEASNADVFTESLAQCLVDAMDDASPMSALVKAMYIGIGMVIGMVLCIACDLFGRHF